MAHIETLQLTTGQSAKLTFEGYASAGYLWAVDQKDSGLDIVHSNGTLPANAGIGASASEVFNLSAAGAGEYTVTFALRRPWEKDGEAAQVRKYRVIVR